MMKFKVTTAKSFYTKDEAKPFKEAFKMKFRPSKYGLCEEGGIVEIRSLEDIMKIVEDFGPIVLENDKIIIYNDYLE